LVTQALYHINDTYTRSPALWSVIWDY